MWTETQGTPDPWSLLLVAASSVSPGSWDEAGLAWEPSGCGAGDRVGVAEG